MQQRLYVETPLGGATFTASLHDQDLIGQHRWRDRNGSIITEITGSTIELGHYILGRHPDSDINFENGNRFDFLRKNVRGERISGSPSTITKMPKVSYLHLNGGANVRIDTVKIPLVDLYSWYVIKVGGRVDIRTNIGTAKLSLHRMLAGAQRGEFVQMANGDPFDCTLTNLNITNKKKRQKRDKSKN